ncbi:agmatinase [Vibrio variabilis]|uniref:Agmatinase n=1 Tax=Vibrio variabilis TaxID=990271 RepID=A0ABQ0JPL2_9VIBR|nr:agmatinase [Vibrio variabilis]
MQIGIRTEYDYDDHGFNVINAMQANDQSAEEIVAQIRNIIGDKPVYITSISTVSIQRLHQVLAHQYVVV